MDGKYLSLAHAILTLNKFIPRKGLQRGQPTLKYEVNKGTL